MTRTVVDTNVLIGLLYPNDSHNERAATALQEAYQHGALLVNSVVYAELAADDCFSTPEELDAFLGDTGIAVEELSADARFAAGEAFQMYLDRRGEGLQCSECGAEATYECSECGARITARQHIAADFLIGAQAAYQADALLTFDQGFYRDYFDAVEIMSVSDAAGDGGYFEDN